MLFLERESQKVVVVRLLTSAILALFFSLPPLPAPLLSAPPRRQRRRVMITHVNHLSLAVKYIIEAQTAMRARLNDP